MEYNYERKEIVNNKIINELDRFTIDFIKVLEKHTGYVIVSGYVSILLGRTRASEDVDLLIPEMKFELFDNLFEDLLDNGYECANTEDVKEAFNMLEEHAIRFFKKGMPIPNIEFKKITSDIQKEAYDNRINVVLKEKTLFISPIELQIAYKLTLMSDFDLKEISSDKDFEDAKHIYEVFKDKLDSKKLEFYVNKLKVNKKFDILVNE